MWSFVEKTKALLARRTCNWRLLDSLKFSSIERLDFDWRVGKHTDELVAELLVNTQGKTGCTEWHTDGWGGYEPVLPDDEVDHFISKVLTQRLERTNGSLRQQTGRWHRRQNKFSKAWAQTKVALRLLITYFNWIWLHSSLKTTAAQRADLTLEPWTWKDITVYSTLW